MSFLGALEETNFNTSFKTLLHCLLGSTSIKEKSDVKLTFVPLEFNPVLLARTILNFLFSLKNVFRCGTSDGALKSVPAEDLNLFQIQKCSLISLPITPFYFCPGISI